MPFPVTRDTYFRPAAAAFPIFPSTVYVAGSVQVDVCGFYPLTAALGGTIDAILGCVFLILPIPLHLKFQVKQLIHMF